MSDPIAESDQLEAKARDLLAALGLEKVGSMGLEQEWLEEISGRELWDFLLVGAVASTAHGHAWMLIAQPSADGAGVAAFMLEARKP